MILLPTPIMLSTKQKISVFVIPTIIALFFGMAILDAHDSLSDCNVNDLKEDVTIEECENSRAMIAILSVVIWLVATFIIALTLYNFLNAMNQDRLDTQKFT